jgi:DNA-binding CsgD family transcriptional regulator
MKGQFGAHIPGERTMYLRMFHEQLREALDTLSDREAFVITMRFGLGDDQPKTLGEIGKALGLTRERVRQIESRSMSKLRHKTRSGPLQEYLDIEHFQIQEDNELGGPAERGLIHCEKHGWSEKPSLPGPTCACCACPVEVPYTGRPQKYCSNSCKQEAYRRRQRDG